MSLDPVPYIRAYVLVVFILPWCICGCHLFREYAHLWRHHHSGRRFFFSRQTLLEAARRRSGDPVWVKLHRQSVTWQRITLFSWLAGGIFLFCGLFWLESHDRPARRAHAERTQHGQPLP